MSSAVETSLIVRIQRFDSLTSPRSTAGLPVHVASSPAAPFSTTLRSARNDSHTVLVAPKNGAHGGPIASSDFQGQCYEVINAGGNLAEIQRFNDGDSGMSKRMMILQ